MESHARAHQEFTSRRHLAHLLTPIAKRPDELANRLLLRFGTLSAMIRASDHELRLCASNDDNWLDSFLSLRQLVFDGLRERSLRSRFDGSNPNFHRHLLAHMGSLRVERLVAYFCDHEKFILVDEVFAEGSRYDVDITIGRLVQRARELGCPIVALVHNHPSGSAEPSVSDLEGTAKLQQYMRGEHMLLEDHLIVGRSKVVSMKSRGIL